MAEREHKPANVKADVHSDWPVMQRRVHERWTDLTEEDLAAIAGDRERLIEVLEERYPRTREVIEREVSDFWEGLVHRARKEPEAEV